MSRSPNLVAHNLAYHAKHNPDGEVMVYGDRRITWKYLIPRVFKLANALIESGVKKDDKVAFMFYNTPEFLEINYAVQVAAAIPVPMNYRFTANEIEYQANHSDAHVLIYDEVFKEAIEEAMPRLSGINCFVCHGNTDAEGVLSYETYLASGKNEDPRMPNEWEDVAVMIYTGGTTGFPKGVMLTYQGHLDMFCHLGAAMATRLGDIEISPEQVKEMGNSLPLPGVSVLFGFTRFGVVKKILKSKMVYKLIIKSAERFLSKKDFASRLAYRKTIGMMLPSMPFFHDASYQMLVMNMMAGNVCFFIPTSSAFDPAEILGIIQNEKPVFMANVPTGWNKLTNFKDFDRYDVSSIAIAINGGGACSVDIKRKIFAKFPNVVMLDMLGQTEMTPVTTFRIDASPDSLTERSLGKSIVDMKVIDEIGNEVPQGEIGELAYKSSWIMKGYYKDEEKTAESMHEGWFKSGDLGYIDENGELRLVDRKKECINTGGEKVFPLEVEEVLHGHPKIEEVCVIGVPDPEWGNTIRAIIQPIPGETLDPEEVKEFCKGKIAGYKAPRSVVIAEELPISPAGKMLRAKIKEQYGNPQGN